MQLDGMVYLLDFVQIEEGLMWSFMEEHRGTNRHSYIVGQSVHNSTLVAGCILFSNLIICSCLH